MLERLRLAIGILLFGPEEKPLTVAEVWRLVHDLDLIRRDRLEPEHRREEADYLMLMLNGLALEMEGKI